VSGIDGGYWNGNRFGVRGSEALGGGLNAIFQLETGFNIDTGTSGQGGRLFGRQAYLGLSGNWGAVVAGRIATVSSGTGAFDMFGAVDPFETGWGINSLGSTFIMANSVRADNAIAYISPMWSGFKFGMAYSTNVNGAETAPQNTNASLFDIGASFTWGPLYAVATYDVVNAPNTAICGIAPNAVSCPDQKMFQIGASWDFKMAKIYGAWASQSDISAINTGDVGTTVKIPGAVGYYDNNAWMLGVSVPIMDKKYGTFLASYQYSDAKNIVRGGVSWEPDYYVWGIGWGYDFSNRTRMYAGYGSRTLKHDTSVPSGVAGVTATTVFNRDQFALGLNHRF